ncbi:type II toxin-antitoxin system ParD family antitoxin [Aminobacter sp. HY435]|uniref:type II toxin-antitoxin system ParD family antitoxin n=1 Tax=Aminobacter sp. HY435 TaxID=2970917 RepID=UPI0022B974A3|nr:type II toxin-antitoxin system ParD family antitoxin [Aminobacter sp. HY435]
MPSSYTLGAHFEGLVRDLVDSGRYASASEVLRDGLRLLEEREDRRQAKLEALRDAVREGIESGEPEAFDFQSFMSELHEGSNKRGA